MELALGLGALVGGASGLISSEARAGKGEVCFLLFFFFLL